MLDFLSSINKKSSMPITRALELINAGSVTGKPVSENDVFAFEMELSNTGPDYHYTRMSSKTIDNYVKDFSNGAPLNIVHNDRRLPIGRIFNAQRDGNKLLAQAYITRGITLDGQSSDDAIRAIETGVLSKVSVGASPTPDTRIICDACSADITKDFCGHMPGDKVKGKVNYYTIDDAHGVEGSLVGQSSNPTTQITGIIRSFSEDFGIKFDRKTKMDFAELFAFLNVDENGFDKFVRQLKIDYDALKASEPELKRKAQLGDEFITTLINDAIKERVRAEGQNSFNEEIYRSALTRMGDVAFIRESIAGYKATADKVFSGGDKRQVDPKEEKTKTDKPRINARNYR